MSYMYEELFNIMREKANLGNPEQTKHLQDHVIGRIPVGERTDQLLDSTRSRLQRFCASVFRKWKESSRNQKVFSQKNKEWLRNMFVIELPGENIQQHSGRPQTSFEHLGERAKRKRTETLRSSTETAEELAYAAQMKLRESGKEDAVKVVKQATQTTPSGAQKMRLALWKSAGKAVVPFTVEESVALFIDAKLTKHQYLHLRSEAKKRNADIYPSYQQVLEEKKCYPPKDAIEIKLQPLLGHTVSRLLASCSPLELPDSTTESRFLLMCKWGCDGSTGQSEYKQKFSMQSGEAQTDRDLFLTSLVPLLLYSHPASSDDKSHRVILWENPRPSSTRYCRPIRFQFIKETPELVQEERIHIQSQIDALLPTSIQIEQGNEISVEHKLVMTMVDGKVCNAVSNNASAQTCYVCKASPTEMNDISKAVARQVDETTFTFGLSTLHAWIRFFEYLLHVGYRLDFKKWQARGSNKELMKAAKRRIQTEFRREMGLLVDVPKPGGSGTCTDGNVARKVFSRLSLSAKILGVEEDLVKRFAVLLRALSSGREIDVESFNTYSRSTAEVFVKYYPWFYMPASVHKILIHGGAIISHALLPIGQLSEEAQEARNKDCKRFRLSNTRKNSRCATNEDLLHMLLISSDPLISSIRKLPKKPSSKLPKEVQKLLLPRPGETDSSEGSHSDSSEAEEH